MESFLQTNSGVPTSEVIEIGALLESIPGDNPAGESLQYVGTHDEIREARRAEEDLEQGDWKRDLKLADWRQVLSLATDALATRTKDLQICAWLAEALVKLHGLSGLRDGLKLMRGLHETFWDNLYPEIDEEDLDARANALSLMDRQTAIAIKEVRLTNSTTAPNFSYLQYEDSKQYDIPEDFSSLEPEQRERIEALKALVTEENKLTTDDWAKAKKSTKRAFFEETKALIDECWAEYQSLDSIMDEKFGRQTPGLGELKKALDAIRSLIDNVVKEKRISEPYPHELEQREASRGGDEIDDSGNATAPSNSIKARQEALRRLGEVADYFRRNEPQSPVSYLVQRAIKWGEMPLEMWLEDVIKDGLVLGSLRETLGLQSTAQDESSEE
jgi:type VI secretion system protein ImpA